MNILKETLISLAELGYTYSLRNEQHNDSDIADAVCLSIIFSSNADGELVYIGKIIKATKKEITLEYILSKINTDSTFTNFCSTFNKIIDKYGLSAYPTSYGIGVFVAISYRNSANISKQLIEEKLNEMGVKYNTEYSNAMWVFRYKISKSAENIKLIASI